MIHRVEPEARAWANCRSPARLSAVSALSEQRPALRNNPLTLALSLCERNSLSPIALDVGDKTARLNELGGGRLAR
jgi:hypothetical protein